MHGIEIGEYVRSKGGRILHIDEIEKITRDIRTEYRFWDTSQKMWGKHCDFVKHSKNIIDLIEVGDIVELVDVLSEEVIYIWDEEMLEAVKQDIKEGQTLKSIVTKENFEQVQYKVGE